MGYAFVSRLDAATVGSVAHGDVKSFVNTLTTNATRLYFGNVETIENSVVLSTYSASEWFSHANRACFGRFSQPFHSWIFWIQKHRRLRFWLVGISYLR